MEYTAADVVAGVSLVVSILASVYTWTTEKRLRSAARTVGEYDAWLVTPVEAKLNTLEVISMSLTTMLADVDEPVERIETLSKAMKREFNPWYFACDALCATQGDKVLTEINAALLRLVDEMLQIENDVTFLTGEECSKRVARACQAFVTSARGSLRAHRLAVS
ncbi:MAG: hypothetical protein BGO05_09865 [Rhizobiales bacterium 63-7]|nr:hypothetical protein [Hyphomicrobiales bacterium]OJU71381.1 MAG: hypothetical protein BGO05_09865 [Rhizobiales bacterium 63-7]